MKFLHILYGNADEMKESRLSEQKFEKVHQAPIEHPIVKWVTTNLATIAVENDVHYLDLPKEQVELFYDVLNEAHAEKSNETPRPWKYLSIPDEEHYPYPIAQYEKEYGALYYEALYKYITALGVILNIFDFEKNRLIVCIQ